MNGVLTSGSVRWTRLLSVAAAALAFLATGNAHAGKLVFEGDVRAAANTLVEDVAQGHLDEAFKLAEVLRNPHDQAFADMLKKQQQAVEARMPAPGVAQRVYLVGESHFGGCIESEYRVSRGDSGQLWTLKFRRGTTGWQLIDLLVRSA